MLIWWGLILHIIQLASIFDIYFTSPLTGRKPKPLPGEKPSKQPTPSSKRLVLFVADGLRAESFIQTDQAPHLKSIISNRGSWGISNTHIPTESRPGHVAMIAGFYEDPSAVTKGWKENPVEFDSVFNKSRYTWSWGSPDILPMFAKGAKGNHIYTKYYSHKEEDFSGKISTTRLDNWVFDRVEKFFDDAKSNNKLMDRLMKDKLVFFLHLLGLDTAGHTHKPHSSQYKHNIKAVDEGVKRIESIVDHFYNDSKTTYVFTADHGMTDWGSHGAGSDHETKTPFLVWGSGIKYDTLDLDVDNLTDIPEEKLINQADICPFMASVIGVDIPVDSVGVLPDVYLDTSDEDKVLHLHKNMIQILKLYNNKRLSIEDNAIKAFYKPYEKMTESQIVDNLNEIDKLLRLNDFNNAKIQCKNVIKTALQGLEYYQNYYQNILLILMTVSYAGWIVWLLTVLIEGFGINQNINIKHKDISKRFIDKMDVFIHLIFVIIFATIVTIVYIQHLPIQYYIYCLLPIVLWWKVSLFWTVWYNFVKNLDRFYEGSYFVSVFKLILTTMLYVIGVVILVSSFFQRWTLSIGLFGLAMFPFTKLNNHNLSTSLITTWFTSCMSLAGFSFLPVVGNQDDKHLVGAAGLSWFICTMIFLSVYSLPMLKNLKETKRENVVMVIPAVMMLLAIQNKYFVSYSFINKNGLSYANQVISWTLAGASFIVPMFSSRWIISRLFCINSSLAVFFILLSVTHEGFFLLMLAINLFCWLVIEHHTSGLFKGMKLSQFSFDKNVSILSKFLTMERSLNSDDFRRSFIFLLYIILSFFGTGNIASINSFDPQWVRCFISQFSPFTMGALILSKTLIPFLYVACTFCAVNLVVKAPTGNLFLIVLIFSDLMGLQFLHMVTNKGSWLDIGTSISHYVIMQTTIFFVSILYGVGQVLTGTSGWNWSLKQKERPKTY